MRRCFVILAALALIAASGLPGARAAERFADPAFKAVWDRTDAAVAAGHSSRSWLWGPQPTTPGLREAYREAPDGQRLVQYFDKARMEINAPGVNRTSPWYVTTGLLPIELITGWMQVGDGQFEERSPALIPAVGDPDGAFPTYADLQRVYTRTGAGDRLGNPATGMLNPDGTISGYDTYRGDPATAVALIEHQHGIPSGFLQFMSTQSGPLGRLFVFGYPVSGAYWVKANVAGVEQPVLVQVFERRVLTYTPANPPAFRVEAGNVGQHYSRWRYGRFPTDFSQFAAAYLRSGPVPVGGAANIFAFRDVASSGCESCAPAVDPASGVAIFGTSGAGLVAFSLAADPAATRIKWMYDPEDSTIFYSWPLLYRGVAYSADASGRLHAVDIATGRARWVSTASEQGLSRGMPITDGQLIYFTEYHVGKTLPYGGRLHAIRLSDGVEVWRTPDVSPAASGRIIFGFGGNIFFNSQDGVIYGYRPTGQPLPGWPTPQGYILAYADNTLYVGRGRTLLALDRAGNVRDSVELPSEIGGPAVVAGGRVYVTTETITVDGSFSEVFGVAAANLKELQWRFALGGLWSAAAVVDGQLYITDAKHLYQVPVVDPTRYRILIVHGDDRNFWNSPPVIAGGRVYVVAGDGTLFIVR